MGLIKISAAHFDPATMLLHFKVTAKLGASLTTVISSIRLAARPVNMTSIRWAIMRRMHEFAV